MMSMYFVPLCECVYLCNLGVVEPPEPFADVGAQTKFCSVRDHSKRAVHYRFVLIVWRFCSELLPYTDRQYGILDGKRPEKRVKKCRVARIWRM